VHPTGGSLRVFRHFAWLEAGSVKIALSRPAHQRVTPAVSLKLITKVSSLSELLSDLAEQAASNALKGRFKTQLNNLARIIPEQEITQNLQNGLIRIAEKRNRIVHEASQVPLTTDEVRRAFDTCAELLTSLANIAVQCGISLDVEEENPF
jgi:hypothetical protein